jgi:hypothetical protein
MAVSKRLRFEILRRDNHACRYCGGVAPDAVLTIDHVVPVTLGGSDDPSNLITACRDCNAGKSSVPAEASLVDDVQQDALRWARAMTIAAERANLDRQQRQERREWFEDVWNEWTHGGAMKKPIPLGGNWENTVDRFFEVGLAWEDLRDAVNAAMSSKVPPDATFRYFCGVAWNMVRRRQEEAKAILDADDTAEPVARPYDWLNVAESPEAIWALDQFAALAAVCDGPRWAGA